MADRTQPFIGARIKAARRAAALTQKALARALGISQAQTARMERGDRNVTLAMLGRLARELKVSELYLIGRDDATDASGGAPNDPATSF